MKARPILFSGDMVRALLEGRKVQTRRIVKSSVEENIRVHAGDRGEEESEVSFTYDHWFDDEGDRQEQEWLCYADECPEEGVIPIGQCPQGKPGDLLYVRESYRLFDSSDECDHMDFPCGCPSNGAPIYRATHDDSESKWTPSIHMPCWASRITLRITSVRVERLQDLSEDDAKAEGCDSSKTEAAISTGWYEKPQRAFRRPWESLNGSESWNTNPWVWVIEFEVIKANVDYVIKQMEADAA